mgnify:CR=1 FL=1
MDIMNPSSIEDHILTTLKDGPLPIVKLIEIIEKSRPRTTKQGVYLIIRKLKKQEIVVVHKKTIHLSSVWLTWMTEFLDQARYNTEHTVSPGNSFLNLKDGEKLQYSFKNPILTDAFWSHVFITLVDSSAPQNSVLIYNPHEWFLVVRTENETSLFQRIYDRGQKLAVLTGHNTALDKSMRVHFDGTHGLYETPEEMPFEKTNYYLNVIGDFVIEAWLDKKISTQMNEFYARTATLNDSAKKELEDLLMQKGKNKFSISHNKRKADTIRRKFKKYFFL